MSDPPNKKMSEEELQRKIDQAETQLGMSNMSRALYMHVASGQQYAVECVTLRESDLVPLVVYRRRGKFVRFTRTVEEFLRRFTRCDDVFEKQQ